VNVQIELIQLLSTLLQKWGVQHYIAFGSLIGLLRDGKPLQNDHDSDLNVYGPHVSIILEKLPFLSKYYNIELLRSLNIDLKHFKSDENDSIISLGYKNNYIDLYLVSWMPQVEVFNNIHFQDVSIPVNPWDNLSSIYKSPTIVDPNDNGRTFVQNGMSPLRQPGRHTLYFKNNVFIDFQKE
jgi:hypothetical protein